MVGNPQSAHFKKVFYCCLTSSKLVGSIQSIFVFYFILAFHAYFRLSNGLKNCRCRDQNYLFIKRPIKVLLESTIRKSAIRKKTRIRNPRIYSLLFWADSNKNPNLAQKPLDISFLLTKKGINSLREELKGVVVQQTVLYKIQVPILKSIENRDCNRLWSDMEEHKKVCRGSEVKFMYIIYNTKQYNVCSSG